jgi:hypothetical protein
MPHPAGPSLGTSLRSTDGDAASLRAIAAANRDDASRPVLPDHADEVNAQLEPRLRASPSQLSASESPSESEPQAISGSASTSAGDGDCAAVGVAEWSIGELELMDRTRSLLDVSPPDMGAGGAALAGDDASGLVRDSFLPSELDLPRLIHAESLSSAVSSATASKVSQRGSLALSSTLHLSTMRRPTSNVSPSGTMIVGGSLRARDARASLDRVVRSALLVPEAFHALILAQSRAKAPRGPHSCA